MITSEERLKNACNVKGLYHQPRYEIWQ